MKEKDILFTKNKILNRFISVKYEKIPKSTKTDFIIKSLTDGLGFNINLNGIERLGLNKNEIDVIKNKLIEINRIFAVEHCNKQKFAISVNKQKKIDDYISKLAIFVSLLAFVIGYISINNSSYYYLMKFTPFFYIIVIILVIKIVVSAILIKPIVPIDLYNSIKNQINLKIEEISSLLIKNQIKITTCPKMFWIKFELIN